LAKHSEDSSSTRGNTSVRRVEMMLYTNCKLHRLINEFVLVAKGAGVRSIFETRGTKADEIWGT
jgi:hypothetical protein